MTCPFCLHEKTEVYNSRQPKKYNQIWRRRRCQKCSKAFTTHETTDPASVIKVISRTRTQAFSHAKLLLSIARVCDHRDDLADMVPYLCDIIEQTLYPIAAAQSQCVQTADITREASRVLKRFDPTSYVKYVSYYAPASVAALHKKIR